MSGLTIATAAAPGPLGRRAVRLIRSLRDFGGDLADCDVLVLVPDRGDDPPAVLNRLGIEVVRFPRDPSGFPFANKVAAIAAAERHSRTPLLAWLDDDTLVLQEPSDFRLPEHIALGYRPVHHRLIGLDWDDPIDGFWTSIFDLCGVSQDRLFPMQTHVGETIRPYLNAGSFVVRGDRGLLADWRSRFIESQGAPEIAERARSDDMYAIFTHQAVFTGVLLASLGQSEMIEFGPEVNYPLHLHDEIPARLQVGGTDELVTARYEDLLDDAATEAPLLLSPALRDWLASEAQASS